MGENLDRVIKEDQCAKYVDDIGIPAYDADGLNKILRATFECIRDSGLKLTMHWFHFGTTEIANLGRTITPEGVKPQKEQTTTFMEKTKFPMSSKALQQNFSFLSYYKTNKPKIILKTGTIFL